jgi:hypothetical protein
MIDLDELEDFFEDLSHDPTDNQINQLEDIFYNDFVDNPFNIDGTPVKVILAGSFIRGFKGYAETFVHLITRESKLKERRQFDPQRANKLHWIKNVLLQKNNARIKYFEYADEKGVGKHHYYFEEADYMVVLKPVTADLVVVTAFCIDAFEKQRYRKRYQEYRDALK